MRAWMILGGVIGLVAQAQAAAPSPVGTWRTFDDKTGIEESQVRIFERGGTLAGRVVSTVNPNDAAHTCDQCEGDRKGQPIIGLEIIRGMRADGGEWDGGTVLDPRTGSVYHGTMRLEDGGQKLVLRGYVGISLFGRSQTWQRVVP